MRKNKNIMTVEVWVVIGAVFILIGTLIMWYFPHKEAKDKENDIKEKGKIYKRLPLDVSYPKICFGTSCFEIQGDDHLAILTDGEGNGKLHIPSRSGNGKGILYSWIQDREMKISLSIVNKQHQVISFISGNEWMVNKSKTIDCNYDLNRYEVVQIEEGKIRVLLQIILDSDNIQLAFETYLTDGTGLFLGNNRISITGEKNPTLNNDLIPIFKYPSNTNLGKANN